MAKAVIIASGRSRRSLNLSHEDELRGNGISYCALCDGHFYKDKVVGVVGAGDSSLEEALYLAKLAKRVNIIVRGKVLAGADELVKRVRDTSNIEILFESTIGELLEEDGKLKGVKLENGSELEMDGLFVYIGFDPILSFKNDANIETEKGYILVDENCETSASGIYAVGDIVKKNLYQIISAECEGAIAATAISRKLTKKK